MTTTFPIICLGEILFDCLADQPDKTLAQVKSWTPYPGGAPANVACGLVKLGTKAGFIGCIGEDQAGDALVHLLETTGVNTIGIQRHPTAPTRQVYVTRSRLGERHFSGFGSMPTTYFADTRLDAEKLPESLFAQADYLVMGTLGLAYPQTQKAIYQALYFAKKHQVKVFIDINWRPVFWLNLDTTIPLIQTFFEQADFIKCSEEEAQLFFQTDHPLEIAQQLPKSQGVLVTYGERGCRYQLGKNNGELPTFAVKVTDTTGAGDAFVAGFLHQCCQQGEKILEDEKIAQDAVTYASAVGTLTTTKLGAISAQPTAQEVDIWLRSKRSIHPPM